jgi:hypothetical protein
MKQRPASVPDRGWRRYVWELWGSREYARNYNDNTWTVFVLMSAIMMGFCFLLFNYCPWTLLNIIATGGITLGISHECYVQANRQYESQVCFVNAGALGLYFQLDLGVHVLYWQLEPYLFTALLTGGGFGLLRRGYNAFIWWLIDKAIGQKELVNG